MSWDRIKKFVEANGLLQGAVGALAAAALTFFAYGDKIFSTTSSVVIVDSTEYSLFKRVTFKGWFLDTDGSDTPVLLDEEVVLSFYETPEHPQVKLIRARISGDVWEHGLGYTSKTWSGNGHAVEDFLRFSYFSTKDGVTFTHGVYVLEKVGSLYQGYWEGKDSYTKKTIRAAYLLTPKTDLSKSDAIASYKPFSDSEIFEVSVENAGHVGIMLPPNKQP